MRLHVTYLTVAMMAAVIPVAAQELPAAANHQAGTNAPQVMPPTQTCPPGYYWLPAGYVAKGKFREAHCARR